MRKRFIAGAVCPRCGQMDRLVSYRPAEDAAPVRECVACGFTERLQLEQPVPLVTRVSPDARSQLRPTVAPGEKVIRFLPLPGKKQP